jgi:Insulinase (Peptidase family M16)
MRTILFSTSFISRLGSRKQNLHLPQLHCSPVLYHNNNNLAVTFSSGTLRPLFSGISLNHLNTTAGFATMATNTASNVGSKVQVLSSNVEKPKLDDRSYRLIRLLDNKLEALLVHDPKTDKSSAAMDVHVGHLSDPKDFPGLAHALEHCLFLGTTPINFH